MNFMSVGALRIAVAGPVLSTSFVSRVLGKTTILVHLREIQGAVEATRKVGNVDIEGELLVENLEKLVFGVAVHQVDTGTDVLVASAAGDEFESEGVATDRDTVCPWVVGAVKSAIGSARLSVRADGAVPSISGVAIRVAVLGVNPAPVGIEDNLTRRYSGTTASLGASLEREGGGVSRFGTCRRADRKQLMQMRGLRELL